MQQVSTLRRRPQSNKDLRPTVNEDTLYERTLALQGPGSANNARHKRMEALLVGLSQGQQQLIDLGVVNVAAQAEAQDSLGRVENTTSSTLAQQTGMSKIVATINKNVKGLMVTTNQILGITTRTHALVQTIHRRGLGAGVSQVILDEWLMFYLYFMLHPLAPMSTELIMSVWQFALVINRSRFIIKDFREGNIIPFSIGDIPRVYFTSPWKAIALIYFYNMKFAEMRGTPEYSTLFTGGIDTFLGLLGSNFHAFFTNLSSSSVFSLGNSAIQGMPIAREAVLEGITAFYSKYTELMDIIHTVCPTFGSDKTVFFNCLATYAVSGITLVVDGVTHYFSAPGYLAQARMLIDMETSVIYWTMSMIWEAIKIVFHKVIKNIGIYFKVLACSVNIKATTWSPAIIPAEWFGVNCKDVTEGTKTKMEGGGNEITSQLDNLLATGTFVLFTSYVLQYTSNNKIVLDKSIINLQENIVNILIKLESSKKIMGKNVLMLENVKYDIENVLKLENASVMKTLSKSVGYNKNTTVRKTRPRARSI
jgi:hypothetical protein